MENKVGMVINNNDNMINFCKMGIGKKVNLDKCLIDMYDKLEVVDVINLRHKLSYMKVEVK